MAVYKNEKSGNWYVMVRYTDWTGERKQKCKRGFSTKREAQEWEHTFLMQKSANPDMTFEAFAELYTTDIRPRIRENTWRTKEHIIRKLILPCFAKRKIGEITPKDVIAWQNKLLEYRNGKGEPYSPCYLKTVHNQLSAIFNYAVSFYNLHSNPAAKAGNMGNDDETEMLIWSTDEYKQFSETIMDKPLSYYAFEMLYWCGIREGELLALTPDDIDFTKQTLRINKSYQRIDKRDVITTPKTKKSIRTIKMPVFLCEELQDYLKMQYSMAEGDRLFPISKHYLQREMTRGAEKSGVKRIRIHDLRHSHVSLLVDMGFSLVAIADRMGHEKIEITLRYAHLFPSEQIEMAERLNNRKGGV